jgi:hypothetical protein
VCEVFSIKSVLTDRVVFFNELNVKQYKTILKSILGDELDYEAAFTNISNVIAQITNISLNEINSLSFLDYFLLLFEIRSNSIGGSIIAETTDNNSTKIDINIQKLINHLHNIDLKAALLPDTINNITIIYKIPSIKNIIEVNANDIENIYYTCLKCITLNDKTVDFENYSIKEIKHILDKLPTIYTTAIIKRVQQLIKIFNDVNLIGHLKGLEDKQLIFNFNIKNLGIILKLLFGEELLSLYENIFSLAKNANIPPQYIEECTPGEYYLYVKKLESANKATSSIPNNSNNFIEDNHHVDLFDIPEMPPITSVSEF